MKRRLLTVATLTPVGALGVSGLALAVWTVASTGATGTAAADTLAAPQTVSTTNVSTSSVTVNVTAGPSSGPTPTGYRVDRTAPSNATGVCTITGSTGSCVDASPVSGQTNTYAVRSLLGTSWVSGTGATASANVPSNDTTAPVLLSLVMRDNDGNGKVDRVVATFNESLASYTAGTAPWTLANVPSGGTLSSVAVTGSAATLTLTEGSGSVDTSVGTFTVALASNANGIRDAAGNRSSFAATAPTDGAAPVRTSLLMQDTNTNGKVDRVLATFSESLATYSAGTAPWTLANVPSAGSLSSVAVASNAATLTLSEGAGAANTGVGSFTVALTANAAGIRDAAGNQTTFTATAPSDGASPVPVLIADTNGTNDGKVETGDTISVTFSEPILASSIAGTTTLTFARGGNGSNTIAAANLISGAVATGLSGNNYVSGTGTASFSFDASLAVSGSTITLTVGTNSAGAANVGTAGSAGTLAYVPSALIKDAANNTAVGSLSPSLKLF